ncbi:Scr1 family TA system antitoxin-like transcriptional regulator [Nocardiopsis synnemataformans]|uniref:Scr1 family TA system antitoxin-like transcriptional regulator n=1 Tax=Nocardiopsis synnemataformans TaxID=61305 RepID=UPI003EB75387
MSGLTQAALSARSRVSQASLSRYLSGKTNPSRKAVEALDTALEAEGSLLATWKDGVKDDLPPFLRDGNQLEGAAARIDLVSPAIIPGLLWCPAYAELVYRAGRKNSDIERLARLRSERLGQISAEVSAVFPVAGLTGVPEAVRTAQIEHMLSLPSRVALHLLPEGTLLLGIPGPFTLFRLRDGKEVALSDHLEGDAVYGDAVLPRVRELVRDAHALALPPMSSAEKLRRLMQ